jgi:S-DNA-T family DNA segregation ATPase FtsK/SpoIIIE
MNWMQKMIRYFRADDIEEMYIDKLNEIEEKEKKKRTYKHEIPLSKLEVKNDLQAKISYQYPKGEFRFPLIKDGSPPLKAPRKTNGKRTESNSKQTKTEPKQSIVSLNEREPRKRVKQKEPVETFKARTIIEKQTKMPFQPTNIPSPVYGFQKAPSLKEIEFELGSHTIDPNRPIRNIKEKLEVASQETQSTEEINFSPEIITDIELPTNGWDAKLDLDVKSEHAATKNSKNASLILFEESAILGDTKNQIDEVETGEPVTSTTDDESPKEDPKRSVLTLEPKVEELPTIEDISEPVLVKKIEEEKIIIPEPTQSVIVGESLEQKDLDPNTVEEKEVIVEIADQVIINHPIEEKVNDLILEETIVTKESIEAQEMIDGENNLDLDVYSYEPVTKSRTHLPFNVMMLKQDKKKLEKETNAPSIKKMKEENVQTSQSIHSGTLASNTIQNDWVDEYQLPPIDFLTRPVKHSKDEEWLIGQADWLDETLLNFGVRAKVVHVTQGPSVTRFEVQPEPGVKVNKITNLSDDIKLSLAAKDIRIEAPIPGKHTIGIEVPNPVSRPVFIREIIEHEVFAGKDSPLTAVLGLDISGQPIVTDLQKMPHGLIAGATGSGKSVCINSILISLLYKSRPDELKLLLIDPKMVELAPYNHIAHLVSPVITDVKAATVALKWAVEEMERRYELFAHAGVRDIHRFNDRAEKSRSFSDKLPYIVIVIDELADLMMMSPADVEEAICRIAQKARACGIHLIIATQRPSVDVITGLIKANVPTRIAFSVSSQVDSRTIIDTGGAERLLGRGDMLFLENGASKPVRLQGTFVTDDEIDEVVQFIRDQREPQYLFQQEELLKKAAVAEEEDDLFYEACEFLIDQGGASTSLLQRRFRVGYNRAARLIEMMEKQGIVSESRGTRPRDVLITESDLEALQTSSSS